MISSRYRYRPVTVFGPPLRTVTERYGPLLNVTNVTNVTERYQRYRTLPTLPALPALPALQTLPTLPTLHILFDGILYSVVRKYM